MMTVRFKAMGCEVEVFVYSESADAARALKNIQTQYVNWEKAFSRFEPSSELSEFNRSSGTPFQPSQIFKEAISLAYRAYCLSDGLVTPFILNALESAGYAQSFDKLSNSFGNTTFSSTDPFGWPLHQAGNTFTLEQGARMDLGGSVKGWSADQAVKLLEHIGPALVNAGGDIAASNAPSKNPWRIGIIDPFNPADKRFTICIEHGAVASSGTDYRNWLLEGEKKHHIIDPRTNSPARTDLISVTIVGDNVMDSETIAKTVLILGCEQGTKWLQQHEEFSGCLFSTEGAVFFVNGFDTLLENRINDDIRKS